MSYELTLRLVKQLHNRNFLRIIINNNKYLNICSMELFSSFKSCSSLLNSKLNDTSLEISVGASGFRWSLRNCFSCSSNDHLISNIIINSSWLRQAQKIFSTAQEEEVMKSERTKQGWWCVKSALWELKTRFELSKKKIFILSNPLFQFLMLFCSRMEFSIKSCLS